MIAFLAIVAAIASVALFMSALSAITNERPHETTRVGPWGLLVRSSKPRRSLSAEERRWQTLLLKAEGDEGTWRDVCDRLAQLERTLGADPPPDDARNFDRPQLRATIARLEALTERERKTQ